MVKFIKNIRSTEFSMKLKEKFFLTKKNAPATTAHFIQAMIRFKNCKNLKKPSQIKREIQICKKYWECYPYHYFIQNLFMADREISDEELINFVPQFFWFKLFLPYYFSPKYSFIGGNKIILEHFFKAIEIDQPETLLIVLNQALYSAEMEQLSFGKIQNEMIESNYEKLFVKPAEGAGGRGIYVFHKNNDRQYKTQQNIFFNEDFLTAIGKNDDYIIQPGVIQDPEISEIYPESVNTCRIITENKCGSARLVCAMLRIGRGHKEIDNISSDGICTYLNIQNGKMGDFATSYHDKKWSDCH